MAWPWRNAIPRSRRQWDHRMGTTRRALLEVGQCATYTKVVGRSVVDLNRLALITGWRGSFFRSYLLEQQGARPTRLPGFGTPLMWSSYQSSTWWLNCDEYIYVRTDNDECRSNYCSFPHIGQWIMVCTWRDGNREERVQGLQTHNAHWNGVCWMFYNSYRWVPLLCNWRI